MPEPANSEPLSEAIPILRSVAKSAKLVRRFRKWTTVDDPAVAANKRWYAERTLSSLGWVNTLKAIYDSEESPPEDRFPLLTLCGEIFPITVFPALPGERRLLDAPLADLSKAVPDWKAFSPHYNQNLRRKHAKLWETAEQEGRFNGPAYILDSFDVANRALTARPGWYYESKVTSHSLDDELMEALKHRPNRTVPLRKLKLRSREHEAADDHPIRNGNARAAAISVATVTMFKNADGGHHILLPLRSDDVEQHPGFYHVAPSGIFSPVNTPEVADWSAQFSVLNCVLREYAEELFNYKDLEQGRDLNGRSILKPAIETNPRVESLLSALNRHDAHVRYCGISVNLLTLRPEIHTLLYIDSRWWESEISRVQHDGNVHQYNFEYVPDRRLAGDQYVLVDREMELLADPKIHPARLVPNAAAAIALALPVAQALAADAS